MTADEPGPDPAASSLETSAILARLPGVSAWTMTVVASEQLTPSVRRVRLRAPGLGELAYEPGQDLMLAVPSPDGGHFRRRYTIRRLDQSNDAVDLDVVVHGQAAVHGPGAGWARRARPGDQVQALGPRGKITVVREADWHLFAGDESGLPAMAAMAESLPPSTRAIVVIEVAGPADEQRLEVGPRVELRWVHRAGEPGRGTELAEALREQPLPPGRGHAYLAGELQQVAALRRVLLERGLQPDQLSPKPYWRRGRANTSQGEPGRHD